MLRKIIRSVRDVGRLIEQSYLNSESKVYTDPETEPKAAIDRLSHEALTEKLTLLRNIPILSEEDPDSHTFLGTEKELWIIDSLDGTRDFLRKNPEFAVSVVYVRDAIPEIAVVYNPIKHELFYALRGTGAFFNDTKIMASESPGRRWLVSLTDYEKGVYGKWDPSELKAMGSIAYKLARVGSDPDCRGVISLTPKSIWDYLGGALIAEEAGFEVSDLQGRRLTGPVESLRIKNLVATLPQFREEILSKIRHAL